MKNFKANMACVIHGCQQYKSEQGSLYTPAISAETVGAKSLFFGVVTIPPGVWHGMKGIGTEPAMLVNTPTEPYKYDQPDEFRADPHKNDIPYDWARKDG